MAAVVGILGQELLGVTPAWYLHGEKVQMLAHMPQRTGHRECCLNSSS